jgi:hypothetical protein
MLVEIPEPRPALLVQLRIAHTFPRFDYRKFAVIRTFMLS